jgi:hypothetical protein
MAYGKIKMGGNVITNPGGKNVETNTGGKPPKPGKKLKKSINVLVKDNKKYTSGPSKPVKAQSMASQTKKKADDFTVNTYSGKRTLSGAEASRRQEKNLKNLYYSKTNNPRDINDSGQYNITPIHASKLPVSSGGGRAMASIAFKQGNYSPAGTRRKRERGR